MQAILFNCAKPESITEGLRELKELLKDTQIKLGGYGNGVDKTKPAEMTRYYRNDLLPADYYEKYVKTWIEECGATVVGGCCGIFPEHIKYAHDRIRGIRKEAQKERTFSIASMDTNEIEFMQQLEDAFQKEGLKLVAKKHVNLDQTVFAEHYSDLIKEKKGGSDDQ